jgi:multiple sugar transport system permease protein
LTLFSHRSSPPPAVGERGSLRPRSLYRVVVGREGLRFTPYLFLAPGFALYALVLLYPIVRAFQISLYDWKILPGAVSDFVGLDNYAHAIHDPVFWHALGNSAFYMAATVPAQIVLGLFVAVLLDARMPARAIFRVLYYLPVVTSWVVVSLLFRYLFSSDTGLVNWVLQQGHVVDHNVNWLQQRWPAMVVISLLGVWKGIGWSMIIFLAALQGVSRELHEAAAIDGANAWGRFRHVSLPGIRATVLFVTIMLVIGGFNVFISVYLMTQGGPAGETEVLLTYMYRQAFDFLDFGYGSALAFMLTTIVLALSLVQMRLFRNPEAA